ncbi:MAG: sulfotransferase [Chromatiales bacterium]|nr:sulfotransferase [Chromatiales bacterium]
MEGQQPDDLPVPFIVGAGRSGTTLLRLMLDAHPELAIPPETHCLHKLIALRPADPQAFVDIVAGLHTWPDLHFDAAELGERLAGVRPFTLRGAVETFFLTYAQRMGKRRWGDKSPSHVLSMTAIQQLLPQVRFIQLVRDGRDVALSYRDKSFGPGADIAAAARFWRERIEVARQHAARLVPGTYLEIRYEDLVTDTRRMLERIAGFLVLPFDEAMLDYHRNAARRLEELEEIRGGDGRVLVPRDQRRSIHAVTHRPPDPSQIGKWRAVYDAEVLARFNAVAGDLLREFGYDD